MHLNRTVNLVLNTAQAKRSLIGPVRMGRSYIGTVTEKTFPHSHSSLKRDLALLEIVYIKPSFLKDRRDFGNQDGNFKAYSHRKKLSR